MIVTHKIPALHSSETRKVWLTPALQVLDLHKAAGASVGPLCDKYGSVSATQGNDSCTVMPKP